MTTPFSHRPFAQGVTFINEALKGDWDEAAKRASMDESEARAWGHWYEKEVCVPWVSHESTEGIEVIEGREGHATSIHDLPLVAKGIEEVEFGGAVYPLAKEGLYRFLVLTQSVRNLIVARENHWLPILQGLSALQVHGNREDGTPVEELKARLPTCAFLCITCGTIASLAASILDDLGFRTRLVGGLTMEDWNTYDNGHALFEVFSPHAEKWVLADVDMGFLFRHSDVYLDAGEMWECLNQRRALELVPLTNAIVDPFFAGAWGFNWFLRFRHKWQDEEGKLGWYKRILQAVHIQHDDKRIYVGDREKILAYVGEESVEVLPYPEWRQRLYALG